MRATAAPEEGNKVRLSVEIDEAEIDEALDEVMRRLSREVRVPGFRPGQGAPPGDRGPNGRGRPRCGARPCARRCPTSTPRRSPIPRSIPSTSPRSTSRPATRPVRSPSTPWSWSDPRSAIPGYQGLVVTLPSLEVTDEEVAAQIDRLRATSGELVEVSRPAQDGDQLTIDIHGTRGEGADGDDSDLDAEDFLYEVGQRHGGPRARRPAPWGQDRGHPHLRRHAGGPRPDRLLPGAGQRREGAGPARGDRRMGGRGLGVRDG